MPNDVDKCTKGVISNCVKSVCVLCVTVVIWEKLTKLCQIKRRPRQRNSKLYNLKQFSSRGKPSFAHLRCENITPNLDHKFAIQSYCLVNSYRAHAMSTQFWVWHFFWGENPLSGTGVEWMQGYRKKINTGFNIGSKKFDRFSLHSNVWGLLKSFICFM